MSALRFTKMHGAGNDFVVLDRRNDATPLDPQDIARIGDRHRGVGFDQLLTIEAPTSIDAVASYRIWNQDGSQALQCGNGVRCIVAWLARAGAVARGERLRLDGPAGGVEATIDARGQVRVAMGVPRFDPVAVPFVADADAKTHTLDVDGESVEIGVASMGNPHALLVVDDVATAPVERLGPRIERHARFPRRVNVGFAQLVDRGAIRLRVFERGVGETLACGSGACAAAAILRRRNLLDERVAVTLPGGTLAIEWAGEGEPLWMSGPATFVFEGELT